MKHQIAVAGKVEAARPQPCFSHPVRHRRHGSIGHLYEIIAQHRIVFIVAAIALGGPIVHSIGGELVVVVTDTHVCVTMFACHHKEACHIKLRRLLTSSPGCTHRGFGECGRNAVPSVGGRPVVFLGKVDGYDREHRALVPYIYIHSGQRKALWYNIDRYMSAASAK